MHIIPAKANMWVVCSWTNNSHVWFSLAISQDDLTWRHCLHCPDSSALFLYSLVSHSRYGKSPIFWRSCKPGNNVHKYRIYLIFCQFMGALFGWGGGGWLCVSQLCKKMWPNMNCSNQVPESICTMYRCLCKPCCENVAAAFIQKKLDFIRRKNNAADNWGINWSLINLHLSV